MNYRLFYRKKTLFFFTMDLSMTMICHKNHSTRFWRVIYLFRGNTEKYINFSVSIKKEVKTSDEKGKQNTKTIS